MAVDAIGILPFALALIRALDATRQRRAINYALLTTLLLLTGQYSYVAVITAFILNLALTWVMLLQGNRIVRFLGRGGQRAATKIASLLLAAIAVKMLRSGLLVLLAA